MENVTGLPDEAGQKRNLLELAEEARKKRNLLELADFLEGLPQESFDMKNIRSAVDGGEISFLGPRQSWNCGTVGCALGWAPYVNEDLRTSAGEYDLWFAYSEDQLGVEGMEAFGSSRTTLRTGPPHVSGGTSRTGFLKTG